MEPDKQIMSQHDLPMTPPPPAKPAHTTAHKPVKASAMPALLLGILLAVLFVAVAAYAFM